MSQKQLIIVGVDPGVTIGYAVLDIKGKLIKTESRKHLDLGTLISEIHSLGKVLLVGVDKQQSPSLVHTFSVKVGAKLVSPRYDMKVMEKNLLTRQFKIKNDHERDSLASALFAFNEYKTLLQKIEKFVKDNNKEDISDKIISLVVLKGFPIRESVNLIEEPEQEKEIKRIIEQKKYSEDDFLSLYTKSKNQKRELDIAKDYNEKLQEEITKVRNEKKYLIELMNKKAVYKENELMEYKEKRIQKYGCSQKSLEEQIKILRENISKLTFFLSHTNEFYLLKKLENLGINEFLEKDKLLNFQEGDIILVNDVSVFSIKTLELLKHKVNTLIYKNKNGVPNLPFLMVNASGLELIEEKHFSLVNKKELDNKRSSHNLLKKVIEEYRAQKK